MYTDSTDGSSTINSEDVRQADQSRAASMKGLNSLQAKMSFEIKRMKTQKHAYAAARARAAEAEADDEEEDEEDGHEDD